MFLVVYDIRDARRLAKAAKILKRYGRRIQKSVFECNISRPLYQHLCKELYKIKHPADSIISYQCDIPGGRGIIIGETPAGIRQK